MKLGDRLEPMTTETKQQTRILVQAAAAACEDKKGTDTRILELDPIDSALSDFFLITSASNDRQTVAIADEIEYRLKKQFGVYPNSIEGRRTGDWILMDYVDFVVHVFLAERREFYDIERLRKSARPLTPAEFDAELKAELTAKTLATRKKKAAAKAKPATKAKPAAKAKLTAKAKPAVKAKKATVAAKPKKAAKKVAPAKPATKKVAAKPSKAAKKGVSVVKAKAAKPAAKKVLVKKIAGKKAPAKKLAAKKSTAKKPAKKK
jgi:ribosome-associated protein